MCIGFQPFCGRQVPKVCLATISGTLMFLKSKVLSLGADIEGSSAEGQHLIAISEIACLLLLAGSTLSAPVVTGVRGHVSSGWAGDCRPLRAFFWGR